MDAADNLPIQQDVEPVQAIVLHAQVHIDDARVSAEALARWQEQHDPARRR